MGTTITPAPSSILRSGANPESDVSSPTYLQATIAVGQVGRHLVTRRGRLQSCMVNVGTCGTAGATTAQFRRIPRGGAAANIGNPFTVDNADADGSDRIAAFDSLDVEAGDIIELNVTAAPTAGANLVWSPVISQIYPQ